MVTSRNYDYLNQLTSISSTASNGSSPVSADYLYNQAKQRTQVIDETSHTWQYQYDALGQVITGEKYDTADQRINNQTYDFDDIGNSKQTNTQKSNQLLQGRKRPRTTNLTEQYQTNPINQYQQITTTQDYTSTTKNYQYDADGNLPQDHQWNYEWNGENRLIAMETREETNRKRIEFLYNPLGRH